MSKSSKKPVLRATALFMTMAAAVACHRSNDGGGLAEASNAVGVAACDEFLADYERCVSDHVPADRKKALAEQISRERAAWRSMAADPGARPGLPQACELARETARGTTGTYGCRW